MPSEIAPPLTHPARAVAEALFAGCTGLIELRAIAVARHSPSEMVARRFVPYGEWDSAAAFVRAHRDRHVYWGVATRRDATSGGLANLADLCAYYVDIDAREDLEAAHAAIARCPLAPSIVVASGGGLHVYWLLREPVAAIEAADNLKRLAHALGGDLAAAEPARMLRVPGTANHKYDPPRSAVVEVFEPTRRYNPADFDWLPDLPAEIRARRPADATAGEKTPDTQQGLLARLRAAGLYLRDLGGGKHAITCPWRAQHTVDSGDTETVVFAPTVPGGGWGFRCLHAHCVDRAIRDLYRWLEHQDRPTPASAPVAITADASASPIAAAPLPTRITQTTAADAFARMCGHEVRYDHRRGQWLLWAGHRWAPDRDGAILRRLLAWLREWQALALAIPDPKHREAIVSAMIRLERADTLEAILRLARRQHPITQVGDQWDRDPWLLGVTNGVVDLRRGLLRAGHPEDAITLSTAVPYEADAPCPTWIRFLEDIFGGDEDLIHFVARAVGYSLTADTTEQCLFLCYGTGANGKSTFLRTLSAVLADYAYTMPFSTLELHQRQSIPNDLAPLPGRRLVTASETNDGTRLNEARVKALTGGDPISARFLHAEYFTFTPVAKFWLAVNHKPVVRDDSHAFWRRVRLLPFARTFPPDRTLSRRLLAEAPGILAWAVRGCLDWFEHGLAPPAAVRTATAEYEAESDVLRDFVDDVLEEVPDSEVPAGVLYEAYVRWAAAQGLNERERLTATAFGRRMGERFRSRRVHGRKYYLGLTTRNPR